MEEIFDDLICLDEEGESLESSTNENLLEIKQQTLYSRTQPESCVNHRRKHDNIARYLDDKQMSSSKHCCYEKTSSMMPSDFHGSERYSRMKTIENMDELVADTSFLEVDSCEGDDTDCLESGKNICLDQSSRKAENRISVNHVSLTSSTVLPMYDDDEDWPYLSGDVDEEAVRLAASVNLDLVEEAKDGSQQDPQKKRITIEKMTDKWNSEQYYNDDESPCHSKNPDKLDDSKPSLRKFSSLTSSIRERQSVMHAYKESSHSMADEFLRYRHQESMKYHELSERHSRVGRTPLFVSSQNRRNSLQAKAGHPSLYSKKTYIPYLNPWRKEEIATNLLKKSSKISGVIKRSYQIKTQSLDNSERKSKEFSEKKTEHEISKKKLRWVLTTEQFQSSGVKANSVEHKDRSHPETVAEHRVTIMTKHHHNTPKGNPIKLRLPNFLVT
ncbi:hypothetical protein ACH3XW_50290 [Acanthocheilonema viteae]